MKTISTCKQENWRMVTFYKNLLQPPPPKKKTTTNTTTCKQEANIKDIKIAKINYYRLIEQCAARIHARLLLAILGVKIFTKGWYTCLLTNVRKHVYHLFVHALTTKVTDRRCARKCNARCAMGL